MKEDLCKQQRFLYLWKLLFMGCFMNLLISW